MEPASLPDKLREAIKTSNSSAWELFSKLRPKPTNKQLNGAFDLALSSGNFDFARKMVKNMPEFGKLIGSIGIIGIGAYITSAGLGLGVGLGLFLGPFAIPPAGLVVSVGLAFTAVGSILAGLGLRDFNNKNPSEKLINYS